MILSFKVKNRLGQSSRLPNSKKCISHKEHHKEQKGSWLYERQTTEDFGPTPKWIKCLKSCTGKIILSPTLNWLAMKCSSWRRSQTDFPFIPGFIEAQTLLPPFFATRSFPSFHLYTRHSIHHTTSCCTRPPSMACQCEPSGSFRKVRHVYKDVTHSMSVITPCAQLDWASTFSAT